MARPGRCLPAAAYTDRRDLKRTTRLCTPPRNKPRRQRVASWVACPVAGSVRHIGWAELEVPARQAIELSVPSSVFRRLVRVGDLDDVQRLVQAFGVLPPLRGIQGEDRADGRVGDSGHVCIPRVKPGPGDDGG